MTECDRRYNDDIYLLKCSKEEGHRGAHSDGTVTWGVDEGFSYIYEGNMVIGTTLPRCEERLDINTQCCEPAEQGRKRCRYHSREREFTYHPIDVTPEMLAASEAKPGDTETLKEAAARAPKFYGKVEVHTADKNGVFTTLNKLSIAERLAERKALNASLSKTTK